MKTARKLCSPTVPTLVSGAFQAQPLGSVTSFSVLPKAEAAPVTNENLKLNVDPAVIPVSVVSEGKIMKDNLSEAEVSEDFIHTFLQKNVGKVKVKDVLVMTIDKNGQVYLQMKKGEKQIFENVRRAA